MKIYYEIRATSVDSRMGRRFYRSEEEFQAGEPELAAKFPPGAMSYRVVTDAGELRVTRFLGADSADGALAGLRTLEAILEATIGSLYRQADALRETREGVQGVKARAAIGTEVVGLTSTAGILQRSLFALTEERKVLEEFVAEACTRMNLTRRKASV